MTDDTKEMLFEKHLFLFLHTLRCCKLTKCLFSQPRLVPSETLPDNCWVLTTCSGCKFCYQVPTTASVLSGYCTCKHFGPLINWLTHASLPCVYNMSVPVLARGIASVTPPHQAHQPVTWAVYKSVKKHNTVAFGLQQSGNERIRVGNLAARDWNIITAIPTPLIQHRLTFASRYNGFAADFLSYLSNDILHAILTLLVG